MVNETSSNVEQSIETSTSSIVTITEENFHLKIFFFILSIFIFSISSIFIFYGIYIFIYETKYQMNVLFNKLELEWFGILSLLVGLFIIFLTKDVIDYDCYKDRIKNIVSSLIGLVGALPYLIVLGVYIFRVYIFSNYKSPGSMNIIQIIFLIVFIVYIISIIVLFFILFGIECDKEIKIK